MTEHADATGHAATDTIIITTTPAALADLLGRLGGGAEQPLGLGGQEWRVNNAATKFAADDALRRLHWTEAAHVEVLDELGEVRRKLWACEAELATERKEHEDTKDRLRDTYEKNNDLINELAALSDVLGVDEGAQRKTRFSALVAMSDALTAETEGAAVCVKARIALASALRAPLERSAALLRSDDEQCAHAAMGEEPAETPLVELAELVEARVRRVVGG